jgi:hypothetical protein
MLFVVDRTCLYVKRTCYTENEHKKGAQRAPILQERETGLEPATACLEGRKPQESRLLAVDQPARPTHTLQSYDERDWHRMLQS